MVILVVVCIEIVFMPKDKIDDTKRIIFGYDFKSYADINGNDTYFEYIDSEKDIQLTVFYVEDNAVARIFIEDHMTMFKSVFEPKRVDYPGQYSRTIECPPEYKPQYFERNSSDSTNVADGKFVYFLGFANSNKVAGACSDDLIAYKHIYGMLNCESIHKIVKIEYFTNITSNNTKYIDEFVERVSCEDI